MKTPLQELKLIIQDMINHGGDDDLFPVLTHIENLLPKEKEVIEQAYTDGFNDNKICQTFDEQYYNQTFNTDL